MRFHPYTFKGGNGGTIAAIKDGKTKASYEIWPLGQMKDREFYSEAAAIQLSERHAASANDRGLVTLPNAHRI